MPRTIKKQALARLKMTYKQNQGLLLPAIQRHVMRTVADLDVSEDERRTDIMHPSDMSKSDWCPRADYYRITQGLQRGDANPSFSMENVWDEGHRIHRKWQGWLWKMGLLYGRFQCKVCDCLWWDVSPGMCPRCDSERLTYREIPLEDEALMIAGHSDGGVLEGGSWLNLDDAVLIEIKSMSLGTLRFEAPLMYQRYLDGQGLDELWRDVKRPFASHMKQGLIYCYLGRERFKKIVFIYECKWNQQAKEFVVTPDFNLIKDILDSARDVAAGVRQGIEPYRPHWTTGPEGRICASCPYKSTCWGITSETTTEAQPTTPVIKARAAVRRKALHAA